MAPLVQNLCRKKNRQNPFSAILRRTKKGEEKVLLSTKPGGGAKGLSGGLLTKKKLLFGFPKY